LQNISLIRASIPALFCKNTLSLLANNVQREKNVKEYNMNLPYNHSSTSASCPKIPESCQYQGCHHQRKRGDTFLTGLSQLCLTKDIFVTLFLELLGFDL
jgi:hypothetical protein